MSKLYVDELHPKTTGSHVSFPDKPAFMAVMTSSQASNNDLVFDKVIFDQGNNYDNTTGIFTAPVAGVYQFTLVYLSDDASGNHDCEMKHNSTIVQYLRVDQDFTKHNTASGTVVVDMAANDTFQCRCNVGEVYGSASHWTTFSRHFVG